MRLPAQAGGAQTGAKSDFRCERLRVPLAWHPMKAPILLGLAVATFACARDADSVLADYFSREVAAIEAQPFPAPKNLAEWEGQRATMQRQLAEMLGLDPMPERMPLNVVQTGEQVFEDIVIENLHYQASPGLYVTANLYRPAKVEGKLPAILYGCGHSDVQAPDGTSLGNKTHYQHHGAWFARHGYVCLIYDTVQLGEIRGEHHGTYRLGRWWWMARGYTPAGVEAWNGMRGIDYLVSRPDVDAERIGVTGRSGGGAYSWWIAALDDRVKVAVPTAGITTLRNHVIDGCVEGHCDCMYLVNTYRWDYDRVAALVAPRPLLIANTDKDNIFPLDGVMTIYNRVRGLYRALGAESKIGLQIAEGPHKDTQALNTGAFAWFERHLKGADVMATFEDAAKKVIAPEKLRVFSALPKDEINTRIDEQFVPTGKVQGDVVRVLREKVFAGWPREAEALRVEEIESAEHDGVVLRAWDFTPQEPFRLRLWLAHRAGLKPAQIERITLRVLEAESWREFAGFAAHFAGALGEAKPLESDAAAFAREKNVLTAQPVALAYVAPRGVGWFAWSGTAKQQTHRLRRFYLLGQTLEGMQVWDIRRALEVLREVGFARVPLALEAQRAMAVNALYASLFEEGISGVEARAFPATHAEGPVYLNVLKYLDVPEARELSSRKTGR
jgi:dienelactone hydrolase